METIQKSNDLRFNTSKVVGNEHIYVKIRLNDECKNGREDFSITGDIYEAGKPKIDRYHRSGGCIHDDILKHFPEYKPFVLLHLADYNGKPTYATENGFYHLKNGFNRTNTEDPTFEAEFCEYYRITKQQFDVLKTSNNDTQYFMHLEALKIFDQWKLQALEAIKMLEDMTGKKFESKATRPDYERIKHEALIQQEKDKIASGYYLPDAVEQRRLDAIKEKINALKDEADKEIKTIKNELKIKTQLFTLGGQSFLDGSIVYTHSKQVKFNWRGYGKPLSPDEILKIKESLVLPVGYSYEN